MVITLLNNYCTPEDVLTLIKKVETPDSLLLERINTFINQSSRLIDDYCNTKFYEQDFSSDYLDSRFSNIFIKDSSLWFPFPVSQIIEIKENDLILSSNDFIFPSGSISQIYRLNSDGELKDWSGTVKVKAKFGYKGLPSCSTNYKTLPFVIRTQCSIFTAYLLGEKKTTGKTSSKTGWENRASGNIPMNSGQITEFSVTTGGGAGTYTQQQGFAFVPDTNVETITPKTYAGKVDIWRTSAGSDSFILEQADVGQSLGWQAPINEVLTDSENLEGFIPGFEYKKLDPYRFII